MAKGEDENRSFDERLRDARARQGLTPRPPVISGGTYEGGPSPLSIGLRVGVELVSALLVAVVIGYWLDRWLHTSPVLLGVFVLLGGAAGVANVWRIMGPGAIGAGATKESKGDPQGGPGGKGRDSGG